MLKLCLIGLSALTPFVGNVWRGVKKDLRKQFPKGAQASIALAPPASRFLVAHTANRPRLVLA